VCPVGLFQLDVALEYGIVFWFVKATSKGATNDVVNYWVGIKCARHHNTMQLD